MTKADQLNADVQRTEAAEHAAKEVFAWAERAEASLRVALAAALQAALADVPPSARHVAGAMSGAVQEAWSAVQHERDRAADDAIDAKRALSQAHEALRGAVRLDRSPSDQD